MRVVLFLLMIFFVGCSTKNNPRPIPNTSHTTVSIDSLANWTITHTLHSGIHHLSTSGTIITPSQSGSWTLSGIRNGKTLIDHDTSWTIPSWIHSSGLNRMIEKNHRLIARVNDPSERTPISTQQQLNRRNQPTTIQTLYHMISGSGYKIRSSTGIWGGREENGCIRTFTNHHRTMSCVDDIHNISLTRNQQTQTIISGSGVRNEWFVHDIIGSRKESETQTVLSMAGRLRLPGLALSVPITLRQITKKTETNYAGYPHSSSHQPKARRLREQIRRHTP
ncbi:MAG: hypothetical protein NZL83_01475 [Candidatus Absconditabacterales bacterium]|nr:hypothetical protein [Candidatus Absconditabacterales bacterium]